MFKYAIVLAAVAVSASLAVHVPGHSEQNAEAGHFVMQQMPEKFMYVNKEQQHYQQQNHHHHHHQKPQQQQKQQQQQQQSSVEEAGGMLESGMSGIIEVFGLPKKALSAVAGHVYGKLKTVGVKTLLKTALIAGLIAVAGVVAAVVATVVAGLGSVLSGICALALHFRSSLNGGGANENGNGNAQEWHLDSIGDFVTGAFNKYEMI